MKAFLQAYVAWVEAGAKLGDKVFTRTYGLCANSNEWERQRPGREVGTECNQIEYEMKAMWEREGLDPVFPFNGGYMSSYDSAGEWNDVYEDGTWVSRLSPYHHENPERMQWVHSQLGAANDSPNT